MKSNYKPLISIIIPVFNGEKFIQQTLNSLYNQTYNNFEVIIVNDGSTDNTEEIVKKYLRPKDIYIYQNNQGVLNLCKTINKGLNNANGELVTMLPSDDYWPQNRLERQYMEFIDNDVVLVYGRMAIVDEYGKVIKHAKEPPKNFFARNNHPIGSCIKYLLKENFISQPTVLIRTKSLKQIGGYLQPEGNYAEDYPTHLELSRIGKFKYLEGEVLAYYRQHSGQMTKNHFEKMVISDNELISNFFNKLTQSEKELTGLNRNHVDQIIQSRLKVIPYMEGKRLLKNKELNAALGNLKSLIRKRGNVKHIGILVILIILSFFKISEDHINRLFNTSE